MTNRSTNSTGTVNDSGTETGRARRGVLPACLLATALVVAGCGSATDGQSESSAADDNLAYTADTGSSGGEQEAGAGQSGDDESSEQDGPPDGDHTHTDTATTVPDTQPTTPTTAGSGLAAVTTIVVSSGGDPDGIYRGVIGELAHDELVVAGAMLPPSPAANVLPLTGLPGTVPNHPAAAVKIDNGPAATPQTGLNSADIVIEEEVEGGVTRFAAIFHSTPSIVGPVRSGRTTDVSLISGLGAPLMIYSGANQITEGILRSQPNIQNRSHGSSSGYWRDDNRRAPSNLYTDTAPHWASAPGTPPPPQFVYRQDGDPVPGAVDDELTVGYAASSARWEWDGQQWLRWQRGDKHLLVSGQQVSAANVVVIEAEKVDTGMVDASGGAVPEFVFVGTGRATVFTEGKRIQGTWTRPTLNSAATLTHSPGKAIELTPGRTWIQLIEAGSGLLG